MRREHEARFLFSAMLVDALSLILCYLFVTELRQTFPDWWPFDLFPGAEPVLAPVGRVTVTRHMLPLLLPIVPLWLASLAFFRAYEGIRTLGRLLSLARISVAVGGAFSVLLALLWSVQKSGLVSRTHLLAFVVCSVPTLFFSHGVIRWSLMRQRLRDFNLTYVALVCLPHEATPLRQALESNPEWGTRVVGLILPRASDVYTETDLQILGNLKQLPEILVREGIHKVFLTGQSWDIQVLRQVAATCENLGVRLGIEAEFLGFRSGQAHLEDYAHHSVLIFSKTPMSGLALFFKRVMDVVGASFALMVSSPILLAAAVAIKLQDGGPVFFKQVRSGLYGRTFDVYKFRTMVVDAEARKKELEAMNEMEGPVFKIKRDPRITRLGAFLRKTSIDEFPQFWNVLRGEMSLVGPRPPIPKEVSEYALWQVRRLSMRPGITCIWQVSGRNDVNFDTWMKMDLEYIDHWSLFLDIKLLLLTVPAVLFARGAR